MMVIRVEGSDGRRGLEIVVWIKVEGKIMSCRVEYRVG